jgi:hypothetical protein
MSTELSVQVVTPPGCSLEVSLEAYYLGWMWTLRRLIWLARPSLPSGSAPT